MAKLLRPKSIDQDDIGLSEFRTLNFIFLWFSRRVFYGSTARISLERAGRHFAEAISVCPREFAEVPESPNQGHVGNGRGAALRLAKFIAGPMQPETMQVGRR